MFAFSLHQPVRALSPPQFSDELFALVKQGKQYSHQTAKPKPAWILGRSLGHDQEKTEKERDFGAKKWAIPDFLAVHGQENFSGMAPLQGRNEIHERFREQFIDGIW